MKILLYICYDGTRFCGYQVQSGARTVQAELNRAAAELFGQECDITGCSRTDSGVHANMFCATVSGKNTAGICTNIPTERIPLALCAHLPEDISVYRAYAVPDSFHARYDVIRKEYIYRIFTRPERSPFEEARSWHMTQGLLPDATELMKRAARDFIGRHDFSSFMAKGSKIKDTVRNVYSAEVTSDGDIITFRVGADGFLYNMVRIMTGTLAAVGTGQIPCDGIGRIIDAHDRHATGMTAPAHGLYLDRVVYDGKYGLGD